MPLSPTVAFGLLMLNVSEVVPLKGMVEAPNALLMVGGATTVTTAVLLVAPAPVSVELTAPVVFDLIPAEIPVTLKLTLHEPLARIPPLRLKLPLPAVTPTTLPLQVLLRPGVAATTNPDGRLSDTATPVRPKLELGLVIVSVRLVDPLSGIADAPNALLIVGGEATTRDAEAVFPVPPFVELTLPLVLL